jgi:hypothetical protein
MPTPSINPQSQPPTPLRSARDPPQGRAEKGGGGERAEKEATQGGGHCSGMVTARQRTRYSGRKGHTNAEAQSSSCLLDLSSHTITHTHTHLYLSLSLFSLGAHHAATLSHAHTARTQSPYFEQTPRMGEEEWKSLLQGEKEGGAARPVLAAGGDLFV